MARTHANARVARQQTPEPDGALTASTPGSTMPFAW